MIEARPPVPTVNLPRKRFTRTEVERLLDIGFFADQRCELIDGELYDKRGQSPPHASTIHTLCVMLGPLFGLEHLMCQLPVHAAGADYDWSVPEPDIAILREDKPEYGRRHPRGDELALAVEVAEDSLSFDLSRKAQIYANAGVPEYWVVDLKQRLVVCHYEPRAGIYRLVRIFSPEDELPLRSAAQKIAVSDILAAVR
jgi:Uma2 family endonuclease